MGSKPDLVADGLFKVGSKIGAGSFGDIHLGTSTDDGRYVGIKLESRHASLPQLQVEARLYRMLEGGTGVPRMLWFGTEGDYNIMVIDLLGPSLEALFLHCKKKLSLKTTLLLADQIVTRIESVHGKHCLHRDIKPDNFLMGLGSRANVVNVIDFGLAKRFRDPHTLIHIPFRENKQLTGTARYASINTHLGMEQSRRDDLESIGYMLVYFLRGSLPWMGIKEASRTLKYQKIGERKMETTIENLCTGLPAELIQYFNYTRSLEFEEEPDYNYLRGLFRQRMTAEKLQWDWIYDWTVMKYEAARVLAERQAEDARTAAGQTRMTRPPAPAARKSARAS